MRERVIIKLGGSLLSPHERSLEMVKSGSIPFDFQYAKDLLELLNKSNHSFVIVIGGGFLNRWYLRSLKNYNSSLTIDDRHKIGMAASNINSLSFHMLAIDILGEEDVYKKVLIYNDYEHLSELKEGLNSKKIIIAAGWRSGHSHDVDSLMFASLFSSNQVLSLKNIDGIYSADPKKDSSAVKKKVLTWPEYRAIIHVDKHNPGASYPIDPVAAQLAERSKIGFTVLDGRDFDSVEEAIKTKLASKGSVVTPEL